MEYGLDHAGVAAIHDVFTLLCDARLRRRSKRWRWAQADRYRLKFLRRLVAGCGLLSGSGEATPLVVHWLELPVIEQSYFLIETWLAEKEDHVRRAMWARWQTAAVGETVSVVDLTGRESLERQRSLWQPLVWLGLAAAQGKAAAPDLIRLSTFAWGEADDRSFPLWRVEENNIWIDAPFNWGELWEVEQAARLREIGSTRLYEVVPNHWKRAVRDGATAVSAVALIERGSGEALPLALSEVLQAVPEVIAERGVLLTFANMKTLEKLRGAQAWRWRLARRVNERQVWLAEREAPLLVRALERRKLTVRSLEAATNRRERIGGEDLHALYLLLAARVMQRLARELALPTPLSEKILQELTADLPLIYQRRLARVAEAQAQQIRQAMGEARVLAKAPPMVLAEIETMIRESILSGGILQVQYQPPAPRPMISRAVIPLRLETWGARAYLIAHCLDQEAVRTFRLDRVVRIDSTTNLGA